MEDEGAWKKISTAVDVSQKIYEFRADALCKEVMYLFQNKLNPGAEKEEGKGDIGPGNGDENGEDGVNLLALNMYKDNSKETLDNPENLLSLKLDTLTFDPMFSKISAEFDGSGYKGLLINCIEVDDRLNYILYNEKLIEGKGFNRNTEDVDEPNFMSLKSEMTNIVQGVQYLSFMPELAVFRRVCSENPDRGGDDNMSLFTLEAESKRAPEDEEHFMEIEEDVESMLVKEINSVQTPLAQLEEDYMSVVLEDNLRNPNFVLSTDEEIHHFEELITVSAADQPVFQHDFDFWNYLEPETWRSSKIIRAEENPDAASVSSRKIHRGQ